MPKQRVVDKGAVQAAFVEAIKADFNDLIDLFTQKDAINFSTWKTLWTSKRMSTVFHADFRGSNPTKVHETILQIALDILLNWLKEYNLEANVVVDTSSLIARVFVLYTAYMTQLSTPRIKFQIDLQSWGCLMQIYSILRTNSLHTGAIKEVIAMLRKLDVEENAFVKCLYPLSAPSDVSKQASLNDYLNRIHHPISDVNDSYDGSTTDGTDLSVFRTLGESYKTYTDAFKKELTQSDTRHRNTARMSRAKPLIRTGQLKKLTDAVASQHESMKLFHDQLDAIINAPEESFEPPSKPQVKEEVEEEDDGGGLSELEDALMEDMDTRDDGVEKDKTEELAESWPSESNDEDNILFALENELLEGLHHSETAVSKSSNNEVAKPGNNADMKVGARQEAMSRKSSGDKQKQKSKENPRKNSRSRVSPTRTEPTNVSADHVTPALSDDGLDELERELSESPTKKSEKSNEKTRNTKRKEMEKTSAQTAEDDEVASLVKELGRPPPGAAPKRQKTTKAAATFTADDALSELEKELEVGEKTTTISTTKKLKATAPKQTKSGGSRRGRQSEQKKPAKPPTWKQKPKPVPPKVPLEMKIKSHSIVEESDEDADPLSELEKEINRSIEPIDQGDQVTRNMDSGEETVTNDGLDELEAELMSADTNLS